MGGLVGLVGLGSLLGHVGLLSQACPVGFVGLVCQIWVFLGIFWPFYQIPKYYLMEVLTLIILKSTVKPPSSMFLFRGGKIRLCVCHA